MLTQTQEFWKTRSIANKRINPSILEGQFGIPSILPKRASIELLRLAPTSSVAPSLSGSPRLPTTLTCNPGVWLAAPSPDFLYQWFSDGVELVGETNQTLEADEFYDGQLITCVVRAVNSVGFEIEQSSNSINLQIVEPINVYEFDVYSVTGLAITNTLSNLFLRFGVITGAQISETQTIYTHDLYVIEGT